jgi:HAD superfamily hydrolase (TIGR01484 family)
MKNKTNLFAFDLDGTLLTSDHEIADSTKEAIQIIKDNGDIPVIATGRHFISVQEIMDEAKIDISVCINGSLVVDRKNDKVIYESFIDLEITKTLIKFALEHKYPFMLY